MPSTKVRGSFLALGVTFLDAISVGDAIGVAVCGVAVGVVVSIGVTLAVAISNALSFPPASERRRAHGANVCIGSGRRHRDGLCMQ